ncbi:2-dehydro-3-deoxygalactonokinase [Sphingomonas sp. NFR15]|uniref:2-dehydro-3-deoxygalactonokinase n=1 Tax=Sphingomonas sp. NFR15 TaxID=1566282 RepID=UPI0008826E87|nr:2-dehydro-3-deoxygalactonokinase [Sphingomonas sp. NFR15]SDA35038.1 2-dehydro-3-deoxygalactonokinase [Sphingomonas sp. NFR15]
MSGYAVLGDWGTTRLRLFRVEAGVVTDRVFGDGIGTPGIVPEAVLRGALAPWLAAGAPEAIRLCGMVGARDGWREVPYADCPATRDAWLKAATGLTLDGVPVSIMAGLACADADGVPDVMRGEEAQLYGALALSPALATGRHIVILPGTHSKWAVIEDGAITGFRTILTGELFALLRQHSTLARGLAAGEAGAEAEGFAAGLARAETGVLSGLFGARAMQLRGGKTPDWALGYLSGLLIGGEIVEMRAALGEAARMTIIGDPHLVDRYQTAFERIGAVVRRLDGDACVLAGLS